MGYSTYYEGIFTLDRSLTIEQAVYLKKFAETRRVKRNAEIAVKFPDPERLAVNLPIGEEGAYFVGGFGHAGQDGDESVTNGNSPPSSQPELWCQWVPTEDRKGIQWDEGEKFYKGQHWIVYLIREFLERWDHTLNGHVPFKCEGAGGYIGYLRIENNSVYYKDNYGNNRKKLEKIEEKCLYQAKTKLV